MHRASIILHAGYGLHPEQDVHPAFLVRSTALGLAMLSAAERGQRFSVAVSFGWVKTWARADVQEAFDTWLEQLHFALRQDSGSERDAVSWVGALRALMRRNGGSLLTFTRSLPSECCAVVGQLGFGVPLQVLASERLRQVHTEQCKELLEQHFGALSAWLPPAGVFSPLALSLLNLPSWLVPALSLPNVHTGTWNGTLLRAVDVYLHDEATPLGLDEDGGRQWCKEALSGHGGSKFYVKQSVHERVLRAHQNAVDGAEALTLLVSPYRLPYLGLRFGDTLGATLTDLREHGPWRWGMSVGEGPPVTPAMASLRPDMTQVVDTRKEQIFRLRAAEQRVVEALTTTHHRGEPAPEYKEAAEQVLWDLVLAQMTTFRPELSPFPDAVDGAERHVEHALRTSKALLKASVDGGFVKLRTEAIGAYCHEHQF